VSRLYSVGWYDDRWRIGKDLEGSSHGLNKVLMWHLTRRTEENREKPVSGQPVSHWDSNWATLRYKPRVLPLYQTFHFSGQEITPPPWFSVPYSYEPAAGTYTEPTESNPTFRSMYHYLSHKWPHISLAFASRKWENSGLARLFSDSNQKSPGYKWCRFGNMSRTKRDWSTLASIYVSVNHPHEC
jgi:hypothetical protein